MINEKLDKAMTIPAGDTSSPLEASPPSRVFGRGDMPAELDRFNWASFFFPWIWAIVYQVWWVLGVVMLLFFLGEASNMFVSVTDSQYGTIVQLIMRLLLAAFVLWIGVRGHELAWRSSLHRQRIGYSEWRTVGSVLAAQKKWLLFGVGVNTVAVLFELIPLTDAAYRASNGIAKIGNAIITVGELVAAVLLSRRHWRPKGS